VSMGMTAALKLEDVARNTQTVLGVEALCAAQAIDLLAPLKPGVGTQRGHEIVRGLAPMLERDRYLAPEIEAAAAAVRSGAFARVAEGLREGAEG